MILFLVQQTRYQFISHSTLYVNLSQKGRIKNDGDIRLNWEIISNFSLNLRFHHNYDRKSPATNAPKTDYGFGAGLSDNFKRQKVAKTMELLFTNKNHFIFLPWLYILHYHGYTR